MTPIHCTGTLKNGNLAGKPCRKFLGELTAPYRVCCPRCGTWNESEKAPQGHEFFLRLPSGDEQLTCNSFITLAEAKLQALQRYPGSTIVSAAAVLSGDLDPTPEVGALLQRAGCVCCTRKWARVVKIRPAEGPGEGTVAWRCMDCGARVTEEGIVIRKGAAQDGRPKD